MFGFFYVIIYFLVNYMELFGNGMKLVDWIGDVFIVEEFKI